jgi:hypothetical protein
MTYAFVSSSIPHEDFGEGVLEDFVVLCLFLSFFLLVEYEFWISRYGRY